MAPQRGNKRISESTRLSLSTGTGGGEDDTNAAVETGTGTSTEASKDTASVISPEGTPSSPKQRGRRSKKGTVATNDGRDYDVDEAITGLAVDGGSAKKRKAPSKKKTKPSKDGDGGDSSDNNERDADTTEAAKSPTKKTKKAADHQRITEIDSLPKLWNGDKAKANGSYTFKIASWNVAGLRALLRKEPAALSDFCKRYNLDMLCLQETKLQDVHLEDPKLKLRGILEQDGYDEYWSCSTAKKGYSGTAVFVKRRGNVTGSNGKEVKKNQTTIGSFFAPKGGMPKVDNAEKNGKTAMDTNNGVDSEKLMPTNVSYKLGKEIDNEGRTVIIDFPWATITNVYVPNSGQNLERLDYRTKEWDKFFLQYMQEKQKDRGLPVIWLGDLNIAHKAFDIWNDGAKHLDKQAGVTPQERASFTEQLESGGFVDAFRRLHPEAKGHYSYWSMRAGNREPNKGLRLDYFVCSPDLFSEDSKVVVRDSYMAMDQLGSDHSPVILELEIKP